MVGGATLALRNLKLFNQGSEDVLLDEGLLAAQKLILLLLLRVMVVLEKPEEGQLLRHRHVLVRLDLLYEVGGLHVAPVIV